MLASLTTGVSGLRAHSLMLEVVGNNLANVNTPAFKGSRVTFTAALSETLRPAMGASDTNGGVNPVQRGLGVKAASIDVDASQGTLEMTGRTLDLAIQGEGYFVVDDGVQDIYTRVGTFNMDAESKLVHGPTGFRVLDVTGQHIIVPTNTRLAPRPTQTINVTGNLDAAALPPRTEVHTTRTPFTTGGAAADATTGLNALDSMIDPAGNPYADGDVISIMGIDAAANPIATVFTYGAANDGTTLGDLRDVVDAAYPNAYCTIDGNGNLVLTANDEGLASLAISFADSEPAGSEHMTWTEHIFNETTPGARGATWTSTISIFDSQGKTHLLSLEFELKSQNTWDLAASIPPSEGTVTDGRIDAIKFNSDGSFAQIAGVGEGDPGVTIDIPGLGVQHIDIDFGTPGGFDGLTQFGGRFSAAPTEQDGYEPGSLSTISVRDDGVIQGTFTNGQVSDIATLQIATFTNPEGLRSVRDGFVARTPNSGLPRPGQAGISGAGKILSGTLESSNVDVAYEFTRLIVAQRGFQVNARTIGTTDEVLEELANLIR